MNDEDFKGIMAGLNDVKDYYEGKRDGFVVHEFIDVKAVRAGTKKSQAAFAKAYHLPVGTVRDWEQRRRVPDAPARALLAIIKADPTLAEKLLARA